MSSKSKHYSRNLHSYLNGPSPMDPYDLLPPPHGAQPSTPSSSSHRSKSSVKSVDNTHPSQSPQQHLSSSNWSLASSVDSAERASLSSVNSSVINLPCASNDPSSMDSPFSVPLHQRLDFDLLTRTSWIDAETALSQIERNKAQGNYSALWLRALLQARFFELGHFIQKNAGMILFVGLLILVSFCVGLKSASIENDVEKLWVEDGGRLEKEMQYVRASLGEGFGSTNEIVIQTPRAQSGSVLGQKAMLFHLEALKSAVGVEVNLFDVNWRLSDICYKLSTPNFEAQHIDSFLSRFSPCSIITPLDCFWEGSQLLGPDSPVQVPGRAMRDDWTTLNPGLIVDIMVQSLKASKSLSPSSTDLSISGPLEFISKFMKRAGITSGYQNKPCLDPTNPFCPNTAPNYNKSTPNIGAELTGGCYGFATKFMHWPEDLIVGGLTKNKTGHIVRAKAMQSIVQLMGDKDLFEFYEQDYKVHSMDWTLEKAKMVLEAWQRKFAEEMNRFLFEADRKGVKHQEIHLFTSTSLKDIMRNFSDVNYVRLAIGYLLMLAFTGYALSRKPNDQKTERSLTILGMVGVMVIILAIASGLGLCALIGLAFNASTTQIIPFLALGLGIYNMFHLAHAYTSDYMISNVAYQFRTGECLKQQGTTIFLSSAGNIFAFIAASFVPLPALRCFCLQAAILLTFISFAVIILFPALASIDLRLHNMYLSTYPFNDQSRAPPSCLVNLFLLVCCCGVPKKYSRHVHQSQSNSSQATHPISSSSSFLNSVPNCSQSQPSYIQPYNYYYLNSISQRADVHSSDQAGRQPKVTKSSSLDSGINTLDASICKCGAALSFESLESEERFRLMRKCSKCGGDIRPQCEGQDEEGVIEQEGEVAKRIDEMELVEPKPRKEPFKLSINYFVRAYFVPLLQRKPIKGLVLVMFIALFVTSILGCIKVNDGLDLTDIVPSNTNEHRFLDFRQKYFSFFYMYAVTKGNFDYPNNQKLLYEYHQSFTRVGAIIKNDDGGLPQFWLSMFRDWLLTLQEAFDRDWATGCITQERWFRNASDDGIHAYKLLVQTGRVDSPIDKELLRSNRLVEDGIINPKAFYNYLTAWVHSDPLTYSASEAVLRPDPLHKKYLHDPLDTELKIPKSQPLTFAQIPFYLNNIRTTGEITGTIEEIRAICRKFEERSLPNFPTGVPFTYWEQYMRLRFYLMAALVLVLAAVFLFTCIFLLNPWTALIIVFVLMIIIVELFGLMGWIGVKLSAIPAVILIISIGIGNNFLVHITMSFLTAIGDRNRRMAMSMQHMFPPVLNGIVSTLIGLSMLAFSEFDFIIQYFFCVLSAVVVIVTFNALILLPVLLSILGPAPEIVPLEHEDRISTPSPPPSPRMELSPSVNNNGAYGNAAFVYPTVSKPKRTPILPRYNRRGRGQPTRVLSEISLSTISEEPNSYQSSAVNTPIPPPKTGTSPTLCPAAAAAARISQTPQPHEIVVQPEFVVETTITNNGIVGQNNCHNQHFATSVTPTSENGSSSASESISSPSPTSLDRDSPSGRSESAASNGAQSSRCSSAASITTTTTTSMNAPTSSNEPPSGSSSSSTTVTTKVMATTKLTIPMVHHPQHHSSASSPMYHQLPITAPSGIPPGAIFFAPNPQYQHTHMSPEPCRNCPGCMAPGSAMPMPMPMPPPSHHHQGQHHAQAPPQPNANTSAYLNHRSGAWNHGMIGPYSTTATSSRQQQKSNSSQQHNWR